MNEKLHIVCLDAPSPPNYGGAIDMFYKVKALAESGKRVILHYYAYRPGRDSGVLRDFCEEIHAYDRKSFLRSFDFHKPYIVRSRINRHLIQRLNDDDAPVLLEGLHTAGLIAFLKTPQRVVLRMHNEEREYYRMLAKAEKKVVRRMYLRLESHQIKNYYRELPSNLILASLSQSDVASFQNDYGFLNVHFIPAFNPWHQVKSREGKGPYCLYHGNMAVAENESAALWLIEQVFSRISTPFVVAGNGISPRVFRAARHCQHIQLVNDPSMEDIRDLVQEAHVNVLPSMNDTGVKLKLLHAAFEGRFCISNPGGVKGSSIENGIIQCSDPEDYIRVIDELVVRAFTSEDKKNRQQLLKVYDNRLNAERLSALWRHYQ